MKRSRWLALLAFVPIIPFLGCTARPFREEVISHETAESKGISSVYVETKNGAIDVRCVKDAQQADIEVTRFANGTTPEDAKKRAEEIEIEVRRDSSRPEILRVVAKFPTVDTSNRGASFRITVPQGVSPDLLTSNGAVAVMGADRDVHAVTSNGRVSLSDVRGSVFAQTSNGEIQARGVEGNVDVTSSNGAIDVERVSAGAIKAVTSNGRIRVVQARGDATLRTSNGRIELRLTSVPDTPTISAVTSNGGISVELPRTANARLRMHCSNGGVDADLKDCNVKDFHSGRHDVTATLNGGAGTVDIESSNGSVTLTMAGDAARDAAKPHRVP